MYKIDTISDYGGFSLLTADDTGENHRRAYTPDDDISDLPDDIQEQIHEIRTPEAIAAYRKMLEVNKEFYDVKPESLRNTSDLEARVTRLEAAVDALQAAQNT
ncbi:MAG: hypothetical protein LBB94_09130, partial [Clostridiales bacterium]|nr:hypothetical protein [Clostridiales bacterium]